MISTFFYEMAIYSNRLISWFNQYFRNTKYIYLEEDKYPEAELLCRKFSQSGERTILSDVLLEVFKTSDTFGYLNLLGNFRSGFQIRIEPICMPI